MLISRVEAKKFSMGSKTYYAFSPRLKHEITAMRGTHCRRIFSSDLRKMSQITLVVAGDSDPRTLLPAPPADVNSVMKFTK